MCSIKDHKLSLSLKKKKTINTHSKKEKKPAVLFAAYRLLVVINKYRHGTFFKLNIFSTLLVEKKHVF